MWLLYANDSGPRQVLSALISINSFAYQKRIVNLSEIHLASKNNVRGVIVGTSRSEEGLANEAEFRLAARTLQKPLVAIEDYPGNYTHLEEAAADVLIVESLIAKSFSKKRLEKNCPRILLGASLRYDSIRNKERFKQSVNENLNGLILWIGQPETADALFTLSMIMPYIKKYGYAVLFKAHPRDKGYKYNAYINLLHEYSNILIDVSECALDEILIKRPCMTLSHFSSLAIEFAFHGIPGANLLFEHSGAAKLKALYGYELPPICQFGGSVAIASKEHFDQIIPKLMTDKAFRMSLMLKFNEYYNIANYQADEVVGRLKSMFN